MTNVADGDRLYGCENLFCPLLKKTVIAKARVLPTMVMPALVTWLALAKKTCMGVMGADSQQRFSESLYVSLGFLFYKSGVTQM